MKETNHNKTNSCVQEEIDLSAWYEIGEPEEFRKIMADTMVIPFGTGLWS